MASFVTRLQVETMKIVRYEDLLNDGAQQDEGTSADVAEESDKDSDGGEDGGRTDDVKGRRKSGKFWKDDRKKASSMVKTRGLRLSLERKRVLRDELRRTKELSRQLVQQRKQEKEEKRARREDNIKRREENQKKAEVVQVIKNTAKIKKMRRKQLRRIEKRDTSRPLNK